MKVNIVMLVKNRPRLTSQALRSLYSNTPKELYNITIIDDDSDTTNYEPARDFALLGPTEQTALLTIANSKSITGQARNLGVYWAEKYWGRGDWLYLSDNDVYFTPHWLRELLTIAEAGEKVYPPIRLVGAWNHPFLGSHSGMYLAEREGYGKPNFHLHDAVAGASQLVRWATWDKYGPLDAHAVGVGQSEDWKMCQDIIKDGGKVGSIFPRAVLNCGITNSFGVASPGADVMLKELQEAKKQFPDLYWE